MSFAILFLLLFMLNLAVAFGAGIYETRIVLPLWFSRHSNGTFTADAATMRRTDTGRRFWGMVTTLPLTLLTLVNIGYAIASHQPGHTWWLGAALVTLLERLSTFVFFIPAAITLQTNNNLPPARQSRLIRRWLHLNYVRNALTLAALLLCMIVFV